MKKQLLLIGLLFATCFGFSASAQIGVHFNIGVQPLWGPTGYDYAQFYYLPDIDMYYDVANGDYVYLDNGQWVTTRYLPPRYHDFDLYHAYKVVINQPRPWLRDNVYRHQYGGFRGRHNQMPIRDSREPKYWANPGHPHHAEWHGEGHGGDRGHGGEHGHGGDRGHGGEHGHDEGHRGD